MINLKKTASPAWLGNGFGTCAAEYDVIVGGKKIGELYKNSLGWCVIAPKNEADERAKYIVKGEYLKKDAIEKLNSIYC